MRISIIVPVLNEKDGLAQHLALLEPLRARDHEVIVVDGGSNDGSTSGIAALVDIVMDAPRGRARQMNAGSAAAKGDVLLFLHADTTLPADADHAIAAALARGYAWGRFDVTIAGDHPLFPTIAWLMNRRSCLTGIASGDQAIFCTRDAFAAAGGFPDIPLMEDIALSRALKRLGRPACVAARVTTSGRRWERHGVLRTVVLMWRLRAAYFFGADPAALACRYGYVPAGATAADSRAAGGR